MNKSVDRREDAFQPVPLPVDRDTDRQSQQRQQQGRVETVPQCQFHRHRSSRDGMASGAQHFADACRHQSHRQTGDAKCHGWSPHRRLTFMRLPGDVGSSSEKRFDTHESHSRDPAKVGQHRRGQKRNARHMADRFVPEFFRDKAERRQHSRHRNTRQGGCQKCRRHRRPQSAELTNIALMHGVINGSSHHKQPAFVQRMCHQNRQGSDEGGFGSDTQQHRQRSQHADRGIGQDLLQVCRPHRQHRAEHHRDRPDRSNHPEPFGRPAQNRMQPCDQIHARFDHRGRMQIRTNRRGSRHRIGQPEVKRKLSRFRERSDQNQNQHRQI